MRVLLWASWTSTSNLSRIAKWNFSISVTNTPVERLFTHSGNTIINHRTRLDADKVNNLLFIKRNMRILKKIYSPASEHGTKRNSNLISTDSTPNKKIKLMAEIQEVDEAKQMKIMTMNSFRKILEYFLICSFFSVIHSFFRNIIVDLFV